MKCANCKHDKHEGYCRVIIDTNVTGSAARGMSADCGCREFVEPPDMGECPGCHEPLVYSYSVGQLAPKIPIAFAMVWCQSCKHIIVAQLLGQIIPQQPGGVA